MDSEVETDVPLAPLTTLGLGGRAARLVHARTAAEVVDAVATADAAGEPVLVLGGGSNVVLADAGFDGLVVHVATRGVAVGPNDPGHVRVLAAAGEPWDAFVAGRVAAGHAGVECLSGVPGSVGATPIQNVGAYGQEVADTVVGVEAYDRARREVVDLAAADCGFGYRTSRFKGSDGWVVLSVTYRLATGGPGGPARYAELARALGVQVGDPAPVGDIRAAVLALRAGKGMVLDPADPDTRSVGSFFTNPVLPAPAAEALRARVAERLGPAGKLPEHPAGDGAGPGAVKVPAAWLIEHAGFARGYGHGHVRISSKHTLALTNRGDGSTAELLDLAREVRDGVVAAFGVELVPEPVLVGCAL